MSNAHATPPGRDGCAQRRYVLGGHPIEVARTAPRTAYRSDPHRQSRRHHLARACNPGGADLIACEDTRVTRKLLDRYAIDTPLTPYHDHNAATARPKLLRRLAEGAAIALVSDAGTPLVSDPGFKLVRAAQEAGHAVTALPGASALLAGTDRRRLADRSILLCRASCRRNRPRGAPASPSSLASRRPWCCSRPDRGLPRRWPTWRPSSATARRRCAASSPNSMRRSGAATSRRWRKAAPRAKFAANSFWSSRRPRAAGAAERRRHGCVAAAGARPRLAQGRRGRGRGRDRPAAPGPVSARARAREGRKPKTSQKTSQERSMARRAEPVEPLGGRVPSASPRSGSACRRKAAPPCFSSPRAIGSWPGAGKRRSARSTSSRGGAAALVFRRGQGARACRRSGGSRDRTRQAPHHRRRRALARPQSRRRTTGHPLRRDAGDARQDAAAHRQRLRCDPLSAGRAP